MKKICYIGFGILLALFILFLVTDMRIVIKGPGISNIRVVTNMDDANLYLLEELSLQDENEDYFKENVIIRIISKELPNTGYTFIIDRSFSGFGTTIIKTKLIDENCGHFDVITTESTSTIIKKINSKFIFVFNGKTVKEEIELNTPEWIE